ncbi:MAG: rhodanese-like domain-containing protein [Cyanobacteria bacterium SZAS LIN-2]|nr:rhodanese-like domain-containing protein [Cyanobacteria bacterium SZAS LIN-3]MBS1996135.1 rhodanese-like domain-containing protein [Cyanobacteria bacterium SZAS LIN-2]MBS2006080.1 rhodanese-like domain-containing protein [Cyanobacteria bacterium SZAS TMP-1]
MKKSLALQALVALTLVVSSNGLAIAKGDCSDKECGKSCADKVSAIPTINRKALKAELSKVTLVEALPESIFSRSHVKGSLNIEMGSEAKLAPELLKDKDAKIVVYCMNTKCHASDAVAKELTKLGYKHVSIYREGLMDMISNGFDMEGTNPKEPIMTKTAAQ